MNRKSAIFIGFAIMAAAAVATLHSASGADGAPTFKVLRHFGIQGGGRWDYLIADADSRRLYLSRTSHVSVLNADTGAQVGDIADTPGVHGISLAPQLGVGFISDGGGDRVTIFDLKLLKTVANVQTGKNPDAILFHPGTNSVFVMNGKSNSATVIDATSRQVVATIPLEGKPEFVTYDGGNVFVNIESKNSIAMIDAREKKLKTTWSIAPCESPSGMAIDREGHQLFSVCDNKLLTVLDFKSGKVVQTLPIGDECDAVSFDPSTGYLFASNNDGTFTIAKKGRSGKFKVIQTLRSQPGSKTMALDTKMHQVFLPAAKFDGNPMAHPRPQVVSGTTEVLVIGR
jgi:YVTN family beta-propeller protein